MKCIKCGQINNDNDIYCSVCGNILSDNTIRSSNSNINISEILTNNNSKYDSIKNNLVDESLINKKTTKKDTEVTYDPNKKTNIFKLLIKPITEINYINQNKNFLLIIITIISLTISNLINTMVNNIWKINVDLYTGKIIREFNIKNLSNLNYVDLLLKDLFIYAGILLGIIIIYYFASLIVNKRIGFKKISNIVCYSIYPFIIGVFIITPFLSLLFYDLKIVLNIIFIIYSLSILTININKELNINNNIKLYLNAVCLSLTFILTYYVYYKVIL